MKIPKTLKIGAHTFKILYPYQFKERSDVYGTCNVSLGEIRISDTDGNDRKLTSTQIGQSLFHEILHAINDIYVGSKLDERDIEGFSQGLFQVLNDNKLI